MFIDIQLKFLPKKKIAKSSDFKKILDLQFLAKIFVKLIRYLLQIKFHLNT